MRVLALDLSLTGTGLADERGAWVVAVKSTGVVRLAVLREAVLDAIHWRRGAYAKWGCEGPGQLCTHVDLVAIEGYSYGSANQAHQLGELGGVIRVALHEAGVPFVVVPPALVKVYACGKGSASKNAVLMAAGLRLGYTGESNDEADASWLHALVKDALGEAVVKMPEAHRKAVPKVAALIEAIGLTVPAVAS